MSLKHYRFDKSWALFLDRAGLLTKIEGNYVKSVKN